MYGLSEEALDDLKEGSRVSFVNMILTKSFFRDNKLNLTYKKGSMMKVTMKDAGA